MKKNRENNKKDLPVLTAGDFILRMANRISESAMSAYAGQAAYMMILSFFPFLLFLLILVPYTPLDANYLITAIENFIPHTFQGLLTSLVSEVYQSNASNAVTIISLTVITMIWLSSKACMSLMIGLDRIYKVEITVPEKGRIARFSRRIPEANAVFAVLLWIYKRLAAMLYTVVFAILLIGSQLFLVFGNQLYQKLLDLFPFLGHVVWPYFSMRTLLIFAVMVLFFNFFYWHVPTVKPKIWRQFPGAIVAAGGWISFSKIFSWYVDHYSNYQSFYGAMTSIAFIMVWLYFCMCILFFGAVLNSIWGEYREEYHRALNSLSSSSDTPHDIPDNKTTE